MKGHLFVDPAPRVELRKERRRNVEITEELCRSWPDTSGLTDQRLAVQGIVRHGVLAKDRSHLVLRKLAEYGANPGLRVGPGALHVWVVRAKHELLQAYG